jgi:hypothetical protein
MVGSSEFVFHFAKLGHSGNWIAGGPKSLLDTGIAKKEKKVC